MTFLDYAFLAMLVGIGVPIMLIAWAVVFAFLWGLMEAVTDWLRL